MKSPIHSDPRGFAREVLTVCTSPKICGRRNSARAPHSVGGKRTTRASGERITKKLRYKLILNINKDKSIIW